MTMNEVDFADYPKRHIDHVYEHAGRQFRVTAIIQPKCIFCPDALEVVFLDDNTRGVIDNSSLIKPVENYTVSGLDN